MRTRLFLIKRLTLLGMVSSVALFLNGCAETNLYDDAWESSLKGCAANCHLPDGTQSDGPDMSTQDKFYESVVGKTVEADYPDWTKAGDCDTLQLINPGNAANSSLVAALVESVSDNQTCDTAFNIHITNNVTSSGEPWTDLVNWINDGAKKE